MKMIRKAAALMLIVAILTGCDAWEEDRKIIVDYRYTSEQLLNNVAKTVQKK